MGLFDIFKREKPETLLDQLKGLVVARYRKLAKINGTAPTEKTSDEEIIMIYQTVAVAFKEAAKERNEEIKGTYIHNIVYKFFQVYEMMGPKFFKQHLDYEVHKYLREGLRRDYQIE